MISGALNVDKLPGRKKDGASLLPEAVDRASIFGAPQQLPGKWDLERGWGGFHILSCSLFAPSYFPACKLMLMAHALTR